MDFGIYKQLLAPLRAKVSIMKEVERDCILCIDEMQISAENCFDPNTKQFYGHVTLGDTKEVGNHITVILLRGLNTNWKQIISCDVTSSSTKGVDTMIRVNEVVEVAECLKLKIKALVSDMGSNNKSMWQSLGIRVSKNQLSTFFFNKKMKIHVFADSQHLLKSLKTALLKCNIVIDEETAVTEELPTRIIDGSFIKDLWKYDLNNSSGLRYLHHLKNSDVHPDHYNKMNVGAAMRVFSIKTASALESAVVNKILQKDALTTAWFVRLIFSWHSIITSRTRKISLTRHNMDTKFQFFERFIDIVQKIVIGTGGWKPLNTGLITSSRSFINLGNELLLEEKYAFILGSRLTQDALENVFSQVRKRAGSKPNALECKRIMKLLIISQFISDINQTNYCNDSDTSLLDIAKYLSKNKDPGFVNDTD